MNCIIADDEPLAREGLRILIEETKALQLIGRFSNAAAAAGFMATNETDLIFLDIQMPGINGIEFAKSLPKRTLVIFTTAHAEYALESYEVEAIDYLLKPIEADRFRKAVSKALTYHAILRTDAVKNNIESIADEYFFIRADRRIFKVCFRDVLFVEGLNNYVMIYTADQKIISAMNIKTIHEQLPANMFVRISKSYIVNINHINSFDNNSVFIGKNEMPIGNAYRNYFFDEFVMGKLLKR